MRDISIKTISDTVKELFLAANVTLGKKECDALKKAYESESEKTAKSVMSTIISNLSAAEESQIPICQDTGMAVVFVDIGQDVHIVGGSLIDAINEGVARAYTDGFFRASVVCDPVFDRINTKNNTPAIIHTNIVSGDKIKITALPKGFGSENKSALKMLKPTSSIDDIVSFVVDTVKNAGSVACPPLFIGVGIGGTFEYAPILAKKALARGIDAPNADKRYAELEEKMLKAINTLGIGPQGFGGKNTALGVNIEYFPTHIAGLPVAVNVCCHVMRHESKTI